MGHGTAKEENEHVRKGNGQAPGAWKPESYYLVKKNYFKVITVGATMRVMIPSFEEWYANQSFYKKVDGPEPGSQLKLTSMSARGNLVLFLVFRKHRHTI
ncbi:MAG: hypothetical protein ACLVFI_00120 [Christensenellales bacterium]